MRYILTLNKVKPSDLEIVGFRALDLALLREKRLNIPLTFIINNQAFEDFMSENGLRAKIEKLFQNKKQEEAYQEVIKLFEQAIIPKDLEAELFEAYESLTIDPGATANKIVSEWDYPFVTVIKSPSYLLLTDDKEGVSQNIRGKKALIKALKLAWASFYSPKSTKYRTKSNIDDSFSIGILVQKMKRINQSANTYFYSGFENDKIIVKSFFGLQDYEETELLGKDVHEADSDSLMITKAQINVQEYSIVRDPETGELDKHELGEKGSKQKIDDRQVYECARITKRAKSFIGKDLKLYLGVRDAYTFIFLANRMIGGAGRETEETEEFQIRSDEQGTSVVEHKYEVKAGETETETKVSEPAQNAQEAKASEPQAELEESEGDTSLGMPKILSEEEVKEEIEKELPPIEIVPEEKKPEEKAVEQEIEKETNLLTEIMQIKEITEKMEEHALNHNKEGYNKEAKKLHDLVKKVRNE